MVVPPARALRAALCLSAACARPEVDLQAPAPQPGMEAVGLLRAPFDGVWPMDNVFDHTPGPRPPGEGELVAADGQTVLGTRGHRGYDWPLIAGTPVRAPGDGEVVVAGVLPRFACPLLGRDVDDQLAVVVRHAAPDGSIWESGLHHLQRVDVHVGDVVRAGQVVGASGGSGCAAGPHLHLQVEGLRGGVKRPVDPYGWSGRGADPWSPDGPSPWLWAAGAAPPWVRDHVVERVPEGAQVAVRAIRYQGWRDERAPQQEYVELVVAPGDASGWVVEGPGGLRWVFPQGDAAADLRVIRLHSGDGHDTPTARFWGSPGPVWPDSGGVLRLARPDGGAAQVVRYGLSSRRAPPAAVVSAGPSCPSAADGCVPVGAPGPVASPAWSPDGRRLAAVVGPPGERVLVAGAVDGADPHLDVVATLPDAARPRWLDDHVVVFDAVDGGMRRIAYVVPGLQAAWAFPAMDLPAEVRDARDGAVLLVERRAVAVDLFVWRPGMATPAAVTADRRDELGGRLAGDHAVYAAAGEAWRAPLGGGPPVSLGPVIQPDVVVAPWRAGAAWVRDGVLYGVDREGPPEAIASGVRSWPASGAPAVVGGEAWVVRDGGVTSASGVPIPWVPDDAMAADVWEGGGRVQVAYIAERGERPASLAIVSASAAR